MICKVPKSSTIRSKIHFYAAQFSFVVVRKHNGKYDLFDSVMGYNHQSDITMNDVVRVVTDHLYSRAMNMA